MARLNKKALTYEVSVQHLGLLFLGKLLLGVGIGILVSQFVADFSIPLIILGVIIVVPALMVLIQKDAMKTSELESKIRRK